MGGEEAGKAGKQEPDSSEESLLTTTQEPKSSRRLRLTAQYMMLMAASTGYLSLGMTLAWPNVLAAQLIQDNSTIFHTHLHLSGWQMDMTGSMVFMGSLPGFLISGWLVGRLGRRWSLLLAALPSMLGSILIGLAYNTHMLLIGRFLEGLSHGMMGVASRTYNLEISDISIRGGTVAMVNLVMQVGSLLLLALGTVMTWYHVMFVNLSALLLHCVFVATVLPESPTFLAVTGRDDEAIAILRRLRGPYADVDNELRLHKEMNRGAVRNSGWRSLLKFDVIQRMVVMCGLFFISIFCGAFVLKVNTIRMLQASGLALSTDLSAIIVYLVLLSGNFTSMLLLDRVGRRRLLALSYAVVVVSYAALGAHDFLLNTGPSTTTEGLQELTRQANTTLTYHSVGSSSGSHQGKWNWLPLLCLAVAAFGQSFGAGPIPWVLCVEYFPTYIRSQAVSVCTLIGGLLSFLSLQLYSPMQVHLTQAGLYWAYGSVAGLGIPYIFLIIKETCGTRVG